jgi:tripartite-type tricarboxylate transporter receptor subunit TctC
MVRKNLGLAARISSLRRNTARAWAKGVAVFALATLSVAAVAAYPERPIKLIVPWPAGGTTDAVSRIIAMRLSEKLASPVVVENRGGANGMIGADAAARSAADGYTLLVASAETHSIGMGAGKKTSYDPIGDFIPITSFAKNPFVLVGRSTLAARTTAELAAFAKANPGKLTYGTWGIGSTGQVAMEMFKGQAGVDFLHVPFQGTAPAETALLGGQIDLMVLPVGRVLALRKTGKIHVYGLMTASKSNLLNDVPTLQNEGYQRMDVANWFGIMVPAKTPAAAVQRLAEDIGAVVRSPEVQAQLRAAGVEAFSLSQDEFRQFVGAEVVRWGEVINRANIQLEQK